MNLEHYIYIKTNTRHKNRILVKLYKNHINVYDIVYKGDTLYLKILYDDYAKVKKNIVTSSFYYASDSGFFRIRKHFSFFKIFCIFFFLFLIYFCSFLIVKVDVVHSNKEIRTLVLNALEDYGIQPLHFKKSYEELQEIKRKVLETYKDRLEWIEIENVGMTYVVRIEERIVNPPSEEEKTCHIVASKSGIVSSVQSSKGESLVHEGLYVQEGDILITGAISFNEEIKNYVCASGKVMAEVWYQTTVHLPITYSNKTRTGKMRYNFSFDFGHGKHKIFKSRLVHYETEENVLFQVFGFTFYQLKEYEIEEEVLEYDLEGGVQKALALTEEKMKLKLKADEKIVMQKVLKKSRNDSTIDVEIFYAVIEDITKVEEFSVIEEEGN